MNTRLPDRRTFASVLVLILIFTACTRAPQSGVNVKSLTADLVFGIPPLDEPIAPPGIELDEEPQEELKTGVKRAPRSPRPTPPPVPCPDAELNKFVADAPLQIGTERPAIGQYRWKVTGPTGDDENSPARGYNRTNRGERLLEPFTLRQVRSLFKSARDPEIDFSFVTRMVEPFPGGDIVDQVYDVDKEVGIFLSEIIRDPDTQGERPFKLDPPIKILPLPVKFGQASADEANGAIQGRAVNSEGSRVDVLSLTGQVQAAQPRMDACGEKIAVVAVNAHLEYTYERNTFVIGPNGFPVPSKETVTEISDYHYGVATQLGGLIAYEHYETPPCSHPLNDAPPDRNNPPDPRKDPEEREQRDPKTGRCTYRTTANDDNPQTHDRPFREFDTNIGQLSPEPIPSPNS